jgi:fructokinase
VKGSRRGPSASRRTKLDVVCFGEILWDIFEQTEAARAKGGGAAAGARFVRELGGAPANVATGLARLGVRSAVIGGVGEDRFGDALVAHLASDGVDTRFVLRLPNRTGVAFITHEAQGEPSFLFYRHDTADVALRAEHVTPAMARARWVLVGTSTLMTPSLARATYAFLEHARAGGAHVFVDLNVRAHLWPGRDVMRTAIAKLVRGASLVKASEADLRELAGARGEAWLEAHAPAASWLITRGGGVASAVGAHGEVTVPARRVRCVDATGAGDAFIAGSLATLVATGASPEEPSGAWGDPRVWTRVLEVGHMLGAKAVSRVGSVRGLVRLEGARAVLRRLSQERSR